RAAWLKGMIGTTQAVLVERPGDRGLCLLWRRWRHLSGSFDVALRGVKCTFVVQGRYTRKLRFEYPRGSGAGIDDLQERTQTENREVPYVARVLDSRSHGRWLTVCRDHYKGRRLPRRGFHVTGIQPRLKRDAMSLGQDRTASGQRGNCHFTRNPDEL
ncbi:MAG: hypothetical protein EOP06_19090, partial [Proteobacteria bacterium]